MFQVVDQSNIDDDREVTLLDMNLNFYNENNEFKENEKVVIQAFLLILSVPKRSRWWRPEYGSVNLIDLLFEPFDKKTADDIADAIQITSNSYANGNNQLQIKRISVSLTEQQAYLVELQCTIDNVPTPPIVFGLKKLN
ncbi:MAG: hypothetical protein ACRC6V_09585 [Bacteroidales bacterium]